MGTYNKAIDAYIAKSAAFARPILEHFRELVHTACPDVEEKMKWSFPHFDYANEMMCSMAAFKQHATVGFWKGAIMKESILAENAKSEVSMGHFGRLTSLKDLPTDKKILAWIKEAMKLNDEGIKLVKKPAATEKTEVEIPAYFIKALAKNKNAREQFNAFSNSHRKEYIQWLTEAKTEATRDSRMATALEWLSEGKSRHWKYQKK